MDTTTTFVRTDETTPEPAKRSGAFGGMSNHVHFFAAGLAVHVAYLAALVFGL